MNCCVIGSEPMPHVNSMPSVASARARGRTRRQAYKCGCVATEYADFPVVEWTVWLKNTGDKDTPLLENIQGLDARFERDARESSCCTAFAVTRVSRKASVRMRSRSGPMP